MVDAICPKCGARFDGPDRMAGQVVQCRCGVHVLMSQARVQPNWHNRPKPAIDKLFIDKPAVAKPGRTTSGTEHPRPLSFQAAGAPPGNKARRRFPRHAVRLPVRIRPISGVDYKGANSGETIDLSGGGAGLLSETAYPLRSTLDLEIVLPKPLGKIAVTAEVIHTRAVAEKQFMGCEFLGADPGLAYLVNEALDLTRARSEDSPG